MRMKLILFSAVFVAALSASAELIPAKWSNPAEKPGYVHPTSTHKAQPTANQTRAQPKVIQPTAQPKVTQARHTQKRAQTPVTAPAAVTPVVTQRVRVDPAVEPYVISAEIGLLQQRVIELGKQKDALEGEIDHINAMRESGLERNLGLEQQLDAHIKARESLAAQYQEHYDELSELRNKQMRQEREIRIKQLELVMSENEKLRELVGMQSETITKFRTINESYKDIQRQISDLAH
jgi:hypothetical protein